MHGEIQICGHQVWKLSLGKKNFSTFLWRMFTYVDKEIGEAILKYNAGMMELIILGKRVYLDPDLVTQATNIPRTKEAILSSRKTPRQEKNKMANKICGREVIFSRNGLKCKNSILEYTKL